MYTCPDCGGPLWHIEHSHTLTRYECHVGHVYSPDVLLVQKSEELEAALWASVRLLKEKAALSLQSAARLRESGAEELAARIEAQTQLDNRYIEVIRQQLLEASPNPTSQAHQIAQVLAAQNRAPSIISLPEQVHHGPHLPCTKGCFCSGSWLLLQAGVGIISSENSDHTDLGSAC